MTRKLLAFSLVFAAGAIVGRFAIPSPSVALAQSRKPVTMTRIFTGPDNQTHAEEVAVEFTGSGSAPVSKLLPITAGELHVAPPGNVIDWHRAPRRQYVITLSGRGEIEVAGGKKIAVGPGQVHLVEDTTGKGHITRVIGTEDRVSLQLPIAESAGR